VEPAGLERPILAVDVVVFSVSRGRLRVLLHRRGQDPFAGAPALPGVAVKVDETLEDAARRALAVKAGWPPDAPEDLYVEQLATFDGLYRDPRGRTVSVAYLGLSPARSAPVRKLFWELADGLGRGSLPFDHDRILEAALARLRGKLRYTNIAGRFFPEAFRIDELQKVYEAVLHRSLNRTNFRNKLLKLGLIEQVRALSEAVGKKGGRPPHLYAFAREEVEAADRDFL